MTFFYYFKYTMDVQLKFLGGAKTVTGSKYLLKIDNYQILVDCGLFQGESALRAQNWEDLPIDITEINTLILTHAHLDHTGYLPKLCKAGYKGDIFCTEPTADLIQLLLRDSAKLQEEEAEFARRKGYSKHNPPLPLYTLEDVEAIFPLLRPVGFHADINLTENISFKYHYAGHILGAAFIEITFKGDTQTKKIVFSGDLGRYEDPVLYPPDQIPVDSDIVLVETTYGNRVKKLDHVNEHLANTINKTFENNGVVLIPAFSVGRTQLILWYLEDLIANKKIQEAPVYMDSPMAISATELYVDHIQHHKIKTEQFSSVTFRKFESLLHIVEEHSASVLLNEIKGPAIIISAAGMMNGGRIMHHLYHRLPNKNDCLLIVGFQAKGTRGEQILSGAETVSIFGQTVAVKCSVNYIEGMSAHADQEELTKWLSGVKDAPKRTFLIHGELESSQEFQAHIKKELGWESIIPNPFENFSLFEGI